ncbi:hypothetical protein C0995_009326 [Termitomyces sp. Mi166|nr:hypothetical protein C0995_009326 [Termitomyces sp. Mi166\
MGPAVKSSTTQRPTYYNYHYDQRLIQPETAPIPFQPSWHASPLDFRPDSSGWYTHILSSSSAPAVTHPAPSPPPGLTRPSRQPAVSPPPSEQTDIIIHDFWKGRFAPFPGFSSRPGHLSARDRVKVNITQPKIMKTSFKPTSQLFPPRSFMTLPITPESSSSSSSSSSEIPTETQDADVFIPQYLKDIQKQPHNLLPLPPVPVFPSLQYPRSFLLPNIIQDLSAPRAVTILSSPPAAECPPLQIRSYHGHWRTLLAWELDHSALEKEKIVLWKVAIKIGIWVDAEFVLTVPGIRENYPRLEIGDLVQLREVYEKLKRGSGMAFECRVTALRKREGLVYLYSPSLKHHILHVLPPNPKTTDGIYTSDDVLPFLFNISFVANARPSFIMETASAAMGAALAVTNPDNLIRRWLFPEPDDLASYSSLAASSIALHQSPVPYLISGPPGTGKTRTVVETVLQILRLQPEACILLCAPSNPATDTLVLRLRPFLQPHEMLRLNHPNRTFAEVPIKITQSCSFLTPENLQTYSIPDIENDKFSLPPWKILMKYRVVVSSCLDADVLVAAHCTNTALMRMEGEVAHALHPHRLPKYRATPHWTHLIIDEVIAVPAEPSILSKVASPMLTPQIVLCGDPQQLGPIVTSDKARAGELDISLLERLFERPLYADHAHARSKSGSKPAEIFTFTPFTNLVKNYRSHPAILMPPSALFYNDSLEPCATNGTISWTGLKNSELPLMFFGHDFLEECVDERATWYNKGEIDKIVEIILSLIREAETCNPPLRAADVGIMAPWREQVWRLRERLRNEKLNAVDVGTVEDYQGRESRVVIISCVRSTPRFLEEDKTKGLGLVFEKKRMNVAITRAKELLVVVGNGHILKQDSYWKGFLEFAIRNKLSKYIETQAIESEEDRGVIIAGGLARDLLSEI